MGNGVRLHLVVCRQMLTLWLAFHRNQVSSHRRPLTNYGDIKGMSHQFVVLKNVYNMTL